VTLDNLVYIPYAMCKTPDFFNAGDAITSMLGGIPLTVLKGLRIRSESNLARSTALATAKTEREEDKDLHIEERIRKRNGRVIPRSQIQSADIDANKRIICVKHTGTDLEIAVENAEACWQKIQYWLSGNIQKLDETVLQGFISRSRFGFGGWVGLYFTQNRVVIANLGYDPAKCFTKLLATVPTDILASNQKNFEINYADITQIAFEKGRISGKMTILTHSECHEFNRLAIPAGQFDQGIATVRSVLLDKIYLS